VATEDVLLSGGGEEAGSSGVAAALMREMDCLLRVLGFATVLMPTPIHQAIPISGFNIYHPRKV
jgi:hypothetical protein